MDLPEYIGEANNLERVKPTEGKAGPKKVETKQFEVNPINEAIFLNELKSINGIGKKTAEDLLLIFPNKECLIDSLKKGRIPIRDDIELKLRKKYG